MINRENVGRERTCNYRHKEQNLEKEQIEWCRYDKKWGL